MRAGSLITTVFGDALLPRGGRIWLGSLIRLLAPLGVNERLVRTAVFRLVKDDWLEAHACGRRTDYALTPAGLRRFEDASRQIYAAQPPHWDRRWRLLLAVGEFTLKEREHLRQALAWQGFGQLGGDGFIHPGADLAGALDALAGTGLDGLRGRLKPLLAASADLDGAADDGALVATAWRLETLAGVYATFVEHYLPIQDALRDHADALDDEVAFQLRTLLIHDFRRSLLRDPQLPAELLPAHWPGQQARHLCRDIYRRLLPASERHLARHVALACADAPAPPLGLDARFRDTDPLAR